MGLTLEEVRRVARLARLELSPEEERLFTEQLGHILQHVESLSRVDTTGVAPTYHVVTSQTVREDKPRPSLPRAKALSQAPDVEAGCFRVPQITEG